MGKRTYQSVDIKRVDVAKVSLGLTPRVVMGLDVAKVRQFASLVGDDGRVVRLVRWNHPEETVMFYDLCKELTKLGHRVEVVMEPSGTYGDPIRSGLLDLGFDVYRVSGKRVHDEAELQDGVASMHDAKAAVVIARVHLEKKGTQLWPLPTQVERELEALRQVYALHRNRDLSVLNRIEALTARHWPELTHVLSLESVTLLELLSQYGSPARVHADAAAARQLMARIGGYFLSEAVIEATVSSSGTTLGVSMLAAEEAQMQALARESLHARRQGQLAEHLLVKQARQYVKPELTALLGDVTAAVLVASGLNPEKYASPGALEKAMGLNLKERSSGRKKGQLTITKRGDSLARKVLFLAALRLIKSDAVVGAWYAAKVQRDGTKRDGQKLKMKAATAVMRKLVGAVWHVGRGKAFDSTKLFDASRLKVLGAGALASSPATAETAPASPTAPKPKESAMS